MLWRRAGGSDAHAIDGSMQGGHPERDIITEKTSSMHRQPYVPHAMRTWATWSRKEGQVGGEAAVEAQEHAPPEVLIDGCVLMLIIGDHLVHDMVAARLRQEESL
jgi:hypothetical protein